MRCRSIAIVATIALTSVPARAEPDVLRPPHPANQRRLRVLPRPFFRPPVTRPPRIILPLVEPPGGRFMPPPVGRGSPLDKDQLPGPAPLSGGFHLTVPMDAGLRAPNPLNRAYEVGRALGACWTPPSDLKWKIITIRLSFKRDGSVNGEPRVPFTDAGSTQRNSDLAHSLLAALKQCTPLPFSPSLGSAIAGEIFAISFTHQDSR